MLSLAPSVSVRLTRKVKVNCRFVLNHASKRKPVLFFEDSTFHNRRSGRFMVGTTHGAINFEVQ